MGMAHGVDPLALPKRAPVRTFEAPGQGRRGLRGNAVRPPGQSSAFPSRYRWGWWTLRARARWERNGRRTGWAV